MSRRTTLITFLVSLTMLVGALVVGAIRGGEGERADLVGPVATTTVSPPPVGPASTTSAATPTVREPARLMIPAVGVDASVVAVGLEPDGEMEVPPASEAGWYLYGPRPGQDVGTAVIAAHVDFDGERGIFFELRRLGVGAEVTVTDAAGSNHRFVVTERYQVDKDELPIDQIFVADGPPGLTLITCGGAFDGGVRSYEDNIVVHAVPA